MTKPGTQCYVCLKYGSDCTCTTGDIVSAWLGVLATVLVCGIILAVVLWAAVFGDRGGPL